MDKLYIGLILIVFFVMAGWIAIVVRRKGSLHAAIKGLIEDDCSSYFCFNAKGRCDFANDRACELFHIDAKPKRINAESDNGKQKPFDVIAKKLSARAVKSQLFAINDGMFCIPTLFHTYCPR